MAENNFKVFNENINPEKTLSDAEYDGNSQRVQGVTTGVADSKLHNKLFRQTSILSYALAKFIEEQGFDALDKDKDDLYESLKNALNKFVVIPLDSHKVDANAHNNLPYVKVAGDTMTGSLVLGKQSRLKLTKNDNREIDVLSVSQESGEVDVGHIQSHLALISKTNPTWWTGTEGKRLLNIDDLTPINNNLTLLNDRVMFEHSLNGVPLQPGTDWNLLNRADLHRVNGSDGKLNPWDTFLNAPDIDYKYGILRVYTHSTDIIYQEYIPHNMDSKGRILARRMWFDKRWTPWYYACAGASNMAIITGLVENGHTVPLPEGFSQNECTVFVAPENLNWRELWMDIREGESENMLNPICWYNSVNRVVTVGMRVKGFDSWTEGPRGNKVQSEWREYLVPGVARYLVIGIHR